MSVLLLSACGGGGRTSSVQTGGTPVELRYAENLTLTEHDGYTEARLRNPWDTTKVLRTYLLVEHDLPLPSGMPEGTVVRTPLSRMLVYTAVHCSLIDQLGASAQIAGVCDFSYIKTESVKAAVNEGRVVDAGASLNPDIERIIDLHPDAILLCPFENSGGFGRIEKLDAPIIECADYMETSPLGSAEWMRFYGRLLGRTAEADSLFAEVEKNYNELKEMASQQPERPRVMAELKSGSAWYVPGGNSTTGKLYRDAGADYLFGSYTQSGGVPLSFETVFDRAQDADVWLMKYNRSADHTYTSLKEEYAPYTRFKPYEARNVFHCNTAYSPFYEDFPFHPDRVLKDLIKILHPTLLPDYEPVYFSRMKE